jgi:HAD superfamily hydrolase (TIGR01549 family)
VNLLFKICRDNIYMPFSVDGIAFDLGNTLILDPFDKVLRMKAFEMRRALSEAGYTCSESEIAGAWSEANRSIDYPFICHFYQEPPIISQCLDFLRVAKRDKPSLITKLLVTYRSGLKAAITGDGRLADIRDALSMLSGSGKRLAVFGNGRMKSHELFLGWAGLAGHFRTISGSEKIGIEKPDSRAFNYILKSLGTAPARSMYVGDDPVNDVAGAKAAGLVAVRYVPAIQASMPWRNYGAKAKIEPDAVIHSFQELPQLVR